MSELEGMFIGRIYVALNSNVNVLKIPVLFQTLLLCAHLCYGNTCLTYRESERDDGITVSAC